LSRGHTYRGICSRCCKRHTHEDTVMRCRGKLPPRSVFWIGNHRDLRERGVWVTQATFDKHPVMWWKANWRIFRDWTLSCCSAK